MKSPWYSEIIRALVIIAGFGLAGYAINQVIAGIILGLIVMIFSLYQQIYRFDKWINQEPPGEVNDDFGVIGNLYNRFTYIQKYHNNEVAHLKTINKRFEESARALPDAVIIMNNRNEVEWLNKACKKLIGLKRKKDVGQSISNLIRYPEFNNYLMREEFQYPLELTSPIDENIRILVHLIPYGRDSRLLVINDITQLYSLDQMRQEFITNTSHELRTPLTVIMGYLETLQGAGKEEDITEIIDALLGQSQRMESIISDMLLLARLESLQNHRDRLRIPVNIPQLIQTVVNDARDVSDNDYEFKVDIEKQLNLQGQETELRSAFSNLLQNAIRYTPTGSKIKVCWKKNKNGAASFTVEDNGPGIASEHLDRLTERFYRVDDSRSRDSGGTGLGLAIVQQIMKHHDGQLLISSKVGKGSQFTCEFPSHMVMGQDDPQIRVVS